MRKPVIVRAEAEADLAEAYHWYEQQVRDLGREFFLCMDAVIAAICGRSRLRRALRFAPPSDGSSRFRPCLWFVFVSVI